MNHSQLVELMHAVLDGEATSDERRELEARLAHDAAARTQYDELQRLFDGLRGVPQPYAPEGLVASVMAGLPSRKPPRPDVDQLFSSSGVFEANLKKARGRSSGDRAPIHRVFQPWAFLRGDTMNEQNSGFSGKRKIVIGSGIAAAAVIVAAFALPGLSIAQTASTPRVDQRQENQEKRIQQGVQSGELTKKETKHLEKGQAKVQKQENKAMADGKMSAKERAKIEKAQDRENKRIFREKHDKQTAKK